MTYKLKFLPAALKEWNKLGHPIQSQFKNKLKERLTNPHVPSAKLKHYKDVYKIKLKTAGYRLVYQVVDDEVVVYILAIGMREKGSIYKLMSTHI